MLLRPEKITLEEKVKLHKGKLTTLHKTHKPSIKDKEAACKLLSNLVDKLYSKQVANTREVPQAANDYEE